MHHLCDKHKFPHLYYILIKKVKKWTSFKPSSSGKGYIGGSRFEWPQVKTIITYQNKKNKKTKKQKWELNVNIPPHGWLFSKR